MKHKIRMLKSEKGVHDGEIYPVRFEEGSEHEIGSDLLSAFVSTGSVELVEEGPQDEPEGGVSKDAGDAAEDKMKKGAPENKKAKK